MQVVGSRHGGNRNATLLATGDYVSHELGTELATMAPTLLGGKLIRLHYSACWDELLHQESSGTAIRSDLPLALKMGLPDAYAGSDP